MELHLLLNFTDKNISLITIFPFGNILTEYQNGLSNGFHVSNQTDFTKS